MGASFLEKKALLGIMNLGPVFYMCVESNCTPVVESMNCKNHIRGKCIRSGGCQLWKNGNR